MQHRCRQLSKRNGKSIGFALIDTVVGVFHFWLLYSINHLLWRNYKGIKKKKEKRKGINLDWWWSAELVSSGGVWEERVNVSATTDTINLSWIWMSALLTRRCAVGTHSQGKREAREQGKIWPLKTGPPGTFEADAGKWLLCTTWSPANFLSFTRSYNQSKVASSPTCLILNPGTHTQTIRWHCIGIFMTL